MSSKTRRKAADKQAHWREIGAVWPHKNGNGFDVVIYEQISVSGRITCTERKDEKRPSPGPPNRPARSGPAGRNQLGGVLC